jgi:peptide/nickel transport system permease protein
MKDYLVRRAPSVLIILFVASVLAFLLPRLGPGDPAVTLAGPDPRPEDVEAIRKELGLEGSWLEQYWRWISGMARLDLGQSYFLRRDVSELIGDRIASTLELAIAATILMIVVGGLLGILAGSPRGRISRALLDGVSTVFISSPSFLSGLALILVFGIYNRWLPVSGEVGFFEDPLLSLQYVLLPAIALSLGPAAIVGRLIQTTMWQVRGEEFVDLAIAKGVRPWNVTIRHVLRNSMGTALVAIGLRVGDLLAGAIIVEAIFARNGLGQLAVSSVQTRDYAVLQVLILGAVAIAVLFQLLTEIGLAALDPRVRLGAVTT